MDAWGLPRPKSAFREPISGDSWSSSLPERIGKQCLHANCSKASKNCFIAAVLYCISPSTAKMKQVIALALLSGARPSLRRKRVLKTASPLRRSRTAEPVAPMTTLEAAVLEATGTEPARSRRRRWPRRSHPPRRRRRRRAASPRSARRTGRFRAAVRRPPGFAEPRARRRLRFDPLSLADSKVQLYVYREAELKHARLAMLAAAGWPLAELWDTGIAKTFGLEPIIEENGGRAVSVLNGGMGKISPVYWVSVVAFAAAVEALSEYKKGQAKAADSQWMLTGSYVPGDLGFDPLGLYTIFGKSESGKMLMETAEIKNGRLAMLAITDVRFGGSDHQEPGRQNVPASFPLRAVLEDRREYHDVQPGSLLPVS